MYFSLMSPAKDFILKKNNKKKKALKGEQKAEQIGSCAQNNEFCGFSFGLIYPRLGAEKPITRKYKNPKQLISLVGPNNMATSRIVLHHNEDVGCLLLFVSNLGKAL